MGLNAAFLLLTGGAVLLEVWIAFRLREHWPRAYPVFTWWAFAAWIVLFAVFDSSRGHIDREPIGALLWALTAVIFVAQALDRKVRG